MGTLRISVAKKMLNSRSFEEEFETMMTAYGTFREVIQRCLLLDLPIVVTCSSLWSSMELNRKFLLLFYITDLFVSLNLCCIGFIHRKSCMFRHPFGNLFSTFKIVNIMHRHLLLVRLTTTITYYMCLRKKAASNPKTSVITGVQ